MKRRLELFLIILLPILGLVFLGGKIMHLTKRPEQKITTTSSKKVVQKSEEEIKKEQVAYLKEHEQEIVDFVKAQNLKVESVKNIGMKLSGAWQEMEHLKVVTK